MNSDNYTKLLNDNITANDSQMNDINEEPKIIADKIES